MKLRGTDGAELPGEFEWHGGWVFTDKPPAEEFGRRLTDNGYTVTIGILFGCQVKSLPGTVYMIDAYVEAGSAAQAA